jgi:hypothetical protein
VIKLFNHYDALFGAQLPSLADIGLIQLDAKSAKTKIKPTPKKKIEEIECLIPVVVKERNEEAKKWLQQNIRNLSKSVTNVEEFVEQNSHYNYASDHFQTYRDRVDLFGQMYAVM